MVVERNWDDDADYIMKKVPVKHTDTQTEAGSLTDNPLLFLNEDDLKELVTEKLSFYDIEVLKSSI